jgi:hypothetical protein
LDNASHRVRANAASRGLVPDSRLFHALADGWHGLEVGRLLAALDLLQLVAGVLPHGFRELPKTLERVADEPHRLHEQNIFERI